MSDPDGARIRLLRADEREALVALLDGWELPDAPGGAGAFFRRYVDDDPTFAPHNVVVAERAGRLVGCVQVFPRTLRVRSAVGLAHAPLGGIGSVFTRPEARGGGVASALLERAIGEMRARGMELSLLFASRHAFYGRLGWRLWPRERSLWLRAGAVPPARRIEPFDPARDLDAAFALHAAHSAALEGTAVRDVAFFRAQLCFAGNPAEDFLVARDGAGAIEAYARGAVLEGVYLVTELARRPAPAAAEALADLVVALMQPRAPDPLAPPARPSADLRQMLVAPCLDDPGLDAALARRGVETKRFTSRDAMLRVLDAAALARRTGIGPRPGEGEWLARIVPPERLLYWPADRF